MVERFDLNALHPLHPMVGADALIGLVSGGDFRTDEGIGPYRNPPRWGSAVAPFDSLRAVAGQATRSTSDCVVPAKVKPKPL